MDILERFCFVKILCRLIVVLTEDALLIYHQVNARHHLDVASHFCNQT